MLTRIRQHWFTQTQPGSQAANNLLPALALIVGILAVSFASFFVRWSNAPGPVTATYRMGFAMLFQLPLFLYAFRRQTDEQPQQSQPIWAVLAGVSMGACQVLWSIGLLMTRVANASLLCNSAPLFVALIAWLVLGQRLNGRFWVGLGLAMVGMTVVIGMDFLVHPSLSQGDLLSLVSAVFYALYYMFVGRSRKSMSTLKTIWVVNLASTVVLVVYCLAAGLPLTGYPLHTWIIFLLCALVPQLIGLSAATYALGMMPSWIVSANMVVQPVVTSLLAIPLLHESLTLAQVLGGCMVLAGIVLVNRSRNQENALQTKNAAT
jgi:drug/metabolite transporter (DMT)-like permease